jgi:hypothetical protein
MDDFNSETDSDYTSYWRDWVGTSLSHVHMSLRPIPTPPWSSVRIPKMSSIWSRGMSMEPQTQRRPDDGLARLVHVKGSPLLFHVLRHM